MATSLISRNVMIDGRRTSLRLEKEFWEAFDEICRREGISKHDLCAAIEECRHKSTRTSAVRALIITYFRAVAMDANSPFDHITGLNAITALADKSGPSHRR